MARRVRLAVVGAGLIGKRHIEHVAREAELSAVVDPSPDAEAVAKAHEVPHYPSLAALLSAERPDGMPDGIIVATPNQLHVEHGLACIAARLPMLIEKPIAADVASAQILVDAAQAAGVPILVGHHRRHNPLIAAAKAEIAAGRLGKIVAVHANCWFHKPDDYFEMAWRTRPGAGPVFLNLIHDVDLMRHLCGRIVAVQAMDSNRVRGFAVEDTAGILLKFENGAIGTLTVSDAVVAPWSWEMTAAENPAYPRTGQFCYLIGGSHGSLSLPDLGFWHNSGARSWSEPIDRRTLPSTPEDPLALQIRHFADVAEGKTEPIVSGREGLETLKVIVAIKQAAESGRLVPVE